MWVLANSNKDPEIVGLAQDQDGAEVKRDEKVVATWLPLGDSYWGYVLKRIAPGVILRDGHEPAVLTLADHFDATGSVGSGELMADPEGLPYWQMTFREDARQRFTDFTKRYVGRTCAAVLDGQLRGFVGIPYAMDSIAVPADPDRLSSDWRQQARRMPAGGEEVAVLWSAALGALVLACLALWLAIRAKAAQRQNP